VGREEKKRGGAALPSLPKKAKVSFFFERFSRCPQVPVAFGVHRAGEDEKTQGRSTIPPRFFRGFPEKPGGWGGPLKKNQKDCFFFPDHPGGFGRFFLFFFPIGTPPVGSGGVWGHNGPVSRSGGPGCVVFWGAGGGGQGKIFIRGGKFSSDGFECGGRQVVFEGGTTL